jgi:hypothetical protein
MVLFLLSPLQGHREVIMEVSKGLSRYLIPPSEELLLGDGATTAIGQLPEERGIGGGGQQQGL